MAVKTTGIVLVVCVIVGAVWYLASNTKPSTQTPVQQQEATSTPPSEAATSTQSGNVTIEYTNAGFSAASASLAQGATVTWKNDSSENLWLASDPHPLHNGYDGTTERVHCATGYTGAAPLDSCKMIAPGQSWSFTFGKIGTWGYHNHADESMRGTVVVTPATAAASITASTTAPL